MMNTVKKHDKQGFTQFDLTNYLLNNLSQFNITPTAKLVLLELSACYNPNKPDMFPKQKTLALKIGISERSVVRAVQELFKAGLIIIECKYTNRYKFTSKIGFRTRLNEKIFTAENMSDDLSQKDTFKNDNLSPHNIEQTKEQIKEHNNEVAEYKILKNYAISRNARNLKAYIAVLKRNGADKEIIKAHNDKIARDAARIKEKEERSKEREKLQEWIADNPKECEKLQEFLQKMKRG